MRFLLSRISLRWQLAILYVACLSAALGLLGLGLFAGLTYILDQSVYSQLQADAGRLASAGQLQVVAPPPNGHPALAPPGAAHYKSGAKAATSCSSSSAPACAPAGQAPTPVGTVVPPAATPVASATASPASPPPAKLGFDQFIPSDVAVRFVDATGQVMAEGGDSNLLRQMVVPAGQLINDLDASGRQQHIDTPSPGRVAVLIEPATTATGVPGILEVGTSLAQIDTFLSVFHFVLLVGGGVALGGGTFLALALTRRVLQPLHRMAGVSWTIAGGDLSRRFTGPAGSREVSTLARNFNHMIDRLEASLRSQQRFTADAAHELRTPLTALGGNVELLLLGADEGDPQRVQKVLRTMDLEIQRLTRLVNDLLQISRVEGQTHLQLARVDVAALLRDVAAELRLVGPHATIDVRAEGALPVLGDRDKLKQVLINIGDNALKFTPPGAAVTMTATRMGQSARLRISDCGPGIPAADLPRIFDRFYRSDASRARISGGMGLGLAIAKAIVDAHHGSIVASSIPGRGATFTIDLPLDVAALAAVPPSAPAANARKEGVHSLVNGVIASTRRDKAR
jgi:two-component system, OmpR family, sensor kinase